MILAVWFKKNLKQALLNQVYTDKAKVNGVNVDDPAIKEKIYKQYLQAYKKGVFNYIKEEIDQNSQQVIPRKYFSGGLEPVKRVDEASLSEAQAAFSGMPVENEDFKVSGLTQGANGNLLNNRDEAMVGIERLSPQQIMDRFNLAYPDALYLSVLIAKYLSDRINPVLGKNTIASALVGNDIRESAFGITDGKALLDDQANSDMAKQVHMRVLELKGGLGTSFKRLATLMRLTDRKTLADKGTDSYFENILVDGFDVTGQPKKFNENISVAELKLLYYIYLAQQNEFSEVEVQELVNPESESAVDNFWNSPYLADKVDDRIPKNEKRTYRQVFSNDPVKGIKGLHFNPDFIVQGVMPVVDAQSGAYLNNEALRSPGGHGAFVAVTMDDNARNQKDLSVPRITVFTNGDGVNNMLPPPVAGWMVRKKAPIVMVTTTKQLLDLKGGLITLLSNKDLPVNIQKKLAHFETLSMDEIAALQDEVYPYLLEKAQVVGKEQLEEFQKMGITLGEKSAQFFNTNVHAQYHNILDPFLSELRGILGDEKFYEIIGPDLITNPKEKSEDGTPQGKKVKVIQLEGASGSALLAMNRFVLTTTDPRIIALKAKYGITRLVYFVNFDEKLRSEVFTPEKFTWDHYLYAFSDLFSVDVNKGRLLFTPSPGRTTLPGIDLGDKTPYEDLEYDINAFGRELSVKGLDYLAIKGEVRFPNAVLKGGVFIKNRSGKVVDLNAQLPLENGRLVLDNMYVNIDQDGNVTTSPVTNLLEAINNFDVPDAAMQSRIDDGTADEQTNVVDRAMATQALGTSRVAKVKVRPFSVFTRVSPKDRTVPIKQGTAGWRAFVNQGGDQQNGEGPFNQANIGRSVAALATQLSNWVKQGTYMRVREDGKLHALVAFDGRANGREFAQHAASVAYAYGMEVDISDDYVSTPEAIGRSLRSLGNKAYDVVIVVTASHNDYRYNGLKIGMNGTIMPDNLSGQVDALANDANFRVSYYHADKDVQFNKVDLKAFASQNYQKAFPDLIASVLSYLGVTRKKLIVDFMHGSDGRYADDYRQMGAEVRKTEPMRDNNFPKGAFLENGKEVPYRPQPIREMLDRELTEFETNTDIPEGSVYSALDGDGDRFAAWVKQDGVAREISPNEVMLLTLWHLKQKNRLPSDLKNIVVTAPTSYMVRKYAESIGLTVIEEPVGFKFLGPHLNGQDSHQAVLAWEESGHGGFRMVSPTGEETTFLDDANAQSLYFLDIVSSLPRGQDVLSVLDGLRKKMKYKLNFDRIAVNATDESKDKIRIPLKEGTEASIRGVAKQISQALGKAAPADENITMTSTQDKEVSLAEYLSHRGINLKLNEGLKLKFDDDSWVMVRMSGTEPLIRIYGELKSQDPRNELNKLARGIFNDQAMTSFPDEELDAQPIDRAATATSQPWERGGIDLNSRTLNLESSGQKVNITFDPAMIEQFKRGDFSGVRIQILDVVPVNLMPLLGLQEQI